MKTKNQVIKIKMLFDENNAKSLMELRAIKSLNKSGNEVYKNIPDSVIDVIDTATNLIYSIYETIYKEDKQITDEEVRIYELKRKKEKENLLLMLKELKDNNLI